MEKNEKLKEIVLSCEEYNMKLIRKEEFSTFARGPSQTCVTCK